MIAPNLRKRGEKRAGDRDADTKLAEAVGLARAIDLDIRDSLSVTLQSLRPSTYLGAGRVEEIAHRILAQDVQLAIIDAQLSPVQQRNLERAWKVKVIDRTGLILEIFGARARTREGRLQVDLAQLEYQKSRLVRSWTHLERQRGGPGFMGGPGETQIEADRRIIADKIVKLKAELNEVRRTRELHRAARRKVPYPIVALVGYTNAGKSTLFNRLTNSSVFTADLLFATLDPTMRELTLPSGRRVVLSDTVGFISNLPTQLIAAFRATLEEVLEAQLIVHVRDVSDPQSSAQAADVAAVLDDLGIEVARRSGDLEIWNKIDRLDAANSEALRNQAMRNDDAIPLSALTGEGVEAFLRRLDEKLAGERIVRRLALEPQDGELLAWAYRHGEVLARDQSEDGQITLTLGLDAVNLGRFERTFGARLS